MDRSLVVVQSKGQGMRYRLLDTIRQYAHKSWSKPVKRRLRAGSTCLIFWTLRLIPEGQLRGPDQVKWQELVKTELDNLRAALRWALRNLTTGRTAHRVSPILVLEGAVGMAV